MLEAQDSSLANFWEGVLSKGEASENTEGLALVVMRDSLNPKP